MDIKDAYLHSTVGVVKSINVDKDNIIYTLADVANTTNSIALPLVTSEYNGLVPKITTTTTRASHSDIVLSASSDGKLNWRLFPTYYKQYTSLDSLPTDGSLEAWYDIAWLHDTQHMDSNCIFVIKAYAHSSAIFTACKGWGQTGNITLLSYCNSYNAGYAYVKGARITKDGVVLILLNVPKAEPGYVLISIGVYGAMGILPNQTLSLSSEIDEDSIIDTKLFVNNSMMAKTFVGDLIGNADSSTNALNINVGALNTNGDYPLLFTQNVTSGNKKIYTDTETALSYNPSTNTLKAKALEIATGDLILQTLSNGNTPSIIFRRGTLNDAPIDWRVYNNSSGLFTIQGNTGEEGWVNMLTLEHASYGNALKSSLPILPTKNNVLDLGSNAAKWANIYSQSFVGNYLTAKTGNLTLEANSSLYIYLRVGTDDTSSIALTSQALLPTLGSKNILNLGSASNKWKSVYATEFVGDLKGTASKWKHDYDWDAVCTIGSWSKILNITGYTSILLSCHWGRNAQAILHTYLITTGYLHAKIILLNSNGYPNNAEVELRVTSSDTNKFCVEVLNNHITGTPEVTFKCRAISIGLSDASIVPIEIFTEGSDKVKSSLVSSKSISSNLNADMLDGAHLSELLRIYDHSKTSLDLVNSPSNSPALFDLENNNLIEGYYNFWYVFNIGRHNEGNFNSQIAVPYQNAIKDSELFIRTANNTTWREWRRVLHSNNYTDYTVSKDGTGATGTWNIDISGTAATATKLATKRKLWGLDFDGSADVSGSLTGVTSINMNGDIVINDGTNKDRFIKFQYANSDNYGWRIGYLGDNNNSATNNYLTIDSYRDTAGWAPALQFKHKSMDATFGASVTATSFIGNLTGNVTGDVTGNADTATKLQTKRKLWGLDFDGTADVKGSLYYVINIIAESGKALTLATPSGSDSSIYLRYNSDDTKSVCLISNAFIPTTASSNILNLGSVNNKWKGVYASNFYGNLDGTYVNKLTGYTKATEIGAIAATDSLNTALGKLEYKTDFIYNDLFGTDNDDVINKWSEIVNFIDSVKETETDILDTFVTRKTELEITGKKTFINSLGTIFRYGNYGVRLIGSGEYGYLQLGQTDGEGTKTHRGRITGINAESLSSLYVASKTTVFDGTVTATKLITKDGTSSQFVKGDGSLDTTTYAIASELGNYVTLNTDLTITGIKTFSKVINSANRGGSWIDGMTNASIMYDSLNALDEHQYHPIIGVKTNGEHVVNLGACIDSVGFYGYKKGRTDNNYDWYFRFNSETGDVVHTGTSITAKKFITSGGTSSKFVKGDGSLDSNTYATTASLGNYVTLNTDLTITGQKSFDKTLIATNNLTIKSKAVNQTPKIVFDEYWTSNNPSWKSEIISDYYGKNVCSTDNFTHGLYIKLGRPTFDNFIILNNYEEPIARISKDKGHWFDGTLTTTDVIRSPRFVGSLYTNWVNSINKAGCDNSNLGWFSLAYSSVQSDTIGFPCINNANGILWLGTHGHDSDSTKIGYGHQLGFSGNGKIYHRYIESGTFPTTNTWKLLAFIPDIPTKVSQLTNDSGYLTSRGYIGTTAVQESSQNQSLTGINDLTLSGNLTIIPYNTDNFITFSYENKTPLSWRLGYLGTGNGDANYFVILSSKATGTSWNNAIRLGNETLDAAFGGNVYPLINNTLSLGTSTYKWSNVYATTFTGNLTGNVTGSATYLPITQINNESEINSEGIRGYSGSGADWTGMDTMAYTAILSVGNASRGFRLWSGRGDDSCLKYCIGNAAGNAWVEKRYILDSNNHSNYTPVSKEWEASTTVGAWSKILNITGYINITLSVILSQNSQASVHTYLISTGYGSAKIIQLGYNGFISNANASVRITKSSELSYSVEILNNYGYNGATKVSIKCKATINNNKNDGSIEPLTYYTTGSGTVCHELISSGEKASNFNADMLDGKHAENFINSDITSLADKLRIPYFSSAQGLNYTGLTYKPIAIPDNSGRDAFILISKLDSWKVGTYSSYFMIGTIYSQRDGNQHNTGVYNIVAQAASYPSARACTLRVNSMDTNGTLRPCIVSYTNADGVTAEYLALRKHGSGTTAHFIGLALGLLSNFTVLNVEKGLTLPANMTIIENTLYDTVRLTTNKYYDGASTHTLLHSGNYQSYVKNCYWANVKISDVSNTETIPTFNSINITNPNTDATFAIKFALGEYINRYGNIYIDKAKSSYWTVGVNDLGTTNNILFVHKSGRVGIGTNPSSQALEVYGNVLASGFIKTGSSGEYVLLGNGGHKALSEITSSASMLTSIPIITNKNYSLSSSSWTDTTYEFTNLETATYAILIMSTNLVASGIMSVYKNLSDSMGDEIPLHVYGTAGWRPYLRTFLNKLQISSNDKTAVSGGRTVTIKIARIL